MTETTSVRTAPRAAGGHAAVEAEGLQKTYRSRAGAVEAVCGVDLRVAPGEIFGFLGPKAPASRRR